MTQLSKKEIHNLTGSPEYVVWRHMLARSQKTDYERYPHRKNKNVTVCLRWQESFIAFLADVGSRPSPAHRLVKTDQTKGYEPENARWGLTSERFERALTNAFLTHDERSMSVAEVAKLREVSPSTVRRWVRELEKEEALPGLTAQRLRLKMVTFKGQTMTLHEWSQRLSISYHTLRNRLFTLEWSVDKALTTPPQKLSREFTHQGKTQSLYAWAKEAGINYATLYHRIVFLEWSFERAITTQGK